MHIDTTDPRAAASAGGDAADQAALSRTSEGLGTRPFGPTFFLGPLRAFVRERCPSPDEGLPRVTVHLEDGSALDVCHVKGLSEDLVALAVYDPVQPFGCRAMATLLVPYAAIARVAIRAGLPHDASLGFDAARRPVVLTDDTPSARAAEELLRAAAGALDGPHAAACLSGSAPPCGSGGGLVTRGPTGRAARRDSEFGRGPAAGIGSAS